MKTFKKDIIYGLSIYLVISFIKLNLNCLSWTGEERTILVLLTCLISLLSRLVKYISSEKAKEYSIPRVPRFAASLQDMGYQPIKENGILTDPPRGE